MTTELRLLRAALVGVGVIAAYIILPSFLPEAADEPQKRYTTGLVNTGNDCFANATFQALASLETLSDLLEHENSSPKEAKPWTQQLLQTIDLLKQEDSRVPRSSNIWPTVRSLAARYNARMSRAQQDAHELLVHILDLLEQEHKGVETELPFKGTITDTIQCNRCGAKTVKDTAFSILERLPGEQILQPQTEVISDYKCETCGPTAITKTTRVSRTPRLLIVHFNRSVYVNESFRNSQAVDIPLSVGILSPLDLRSVVYHNGNHYRGHYTAARRKILQQSAEDRSRNWWLINDEKVTSGSTRKALSRTSDAYMLFYEARPHKHTPRDAAAAES